jgi:hypothetical protein
VGSDLANTVDFAMSLGPAAEIIRLAKDDAELIRAKLETEISEALADLAQPDGVWSTTSTWVIAARNP